MIVRDPHAEPFVPPTATESQSMSQQALFERWQPYRLKYLQHRGKRMPSIGADELLQQYNFLLWGLATEGKLVGDPDEVATRVHFSARQAVDACIEQSGPVVVPRRVRNQHRKATGEQHPAMLRIPMPSPSDLPDGRVGAGTRGLSVPDDIEQSDTMLDLLSACANDHERDIILRLSLAQNVKEIARALNTSASKVYAIRSEIERRYKARAML